ncbi:MAG: hypothetical protein ACK4UJ_05255 [Leptonema sp. (in: bacteria)]
MFQLEITEKNKETNFLYHIKFKPTKEIYEQYKVPGQYGIFNVNGNTKLYFAFANAPLIYPEWEILVKNVNEFTNQILQSDFVYLETIEGKGFPLEKLEYKKISAFAMGSGIAPIRALIQYYLNRKINLTELELWMCCFTFEDLPFKNNFKEWESFFKIHYVFDKETPYENVVQKLKRNKIDFFDRTVIWIGSKEYGLDLKNCLLELGLSESQFLSNI